MVLAIKQLIKEKLVKMQELASRILIDGGGYSRFIQIYQYVVCSL